jgi:hypothetical protein
MSSRIMLAMALVIASGSVQSKMSPCDTDCEKSYKVCASSGKMSEGACMVALQKCRKACKKKAKSIGPMG